MNFRIIFLLLVANIWVSCGNETDNSRNSVLSHTDSDGMVLLSSGKFVMGDIQEVGNIDESPAHSVTLSKNFYISDHEVTEKEYRE